MISKIAFTSLLCAVSLAAAPIQTINFDGNLKIPTKVLQKNVQSHIGKNGDQDQIKAILEETEAYYRNHNYTLAFAQAEPIDEKNGAVTVKIGKYADFNELSIGEMKRRAIQEGAINQIFFEGNEKISTYRLMKLVQPSLGKKNNAANLDEIALNVQKYYRKHNYELAYAEVKNVNEKGIVTIEIKKYPNFKALYARENKKQPAAI